MGAFIKRAVVRVRSRDWDLDGGRVLIALRTVCIGLG